MIYRQGCKGCSDETSPQTFTGSESNTEVRDCTLEIMYNQLSGWANISLHIKSVGHSCIFKARHGSTLFDPSTWGQFEREPSVQGQPKLHGDHLKSHPLTRTQKKLDMLQQYIYNQKMLN